MRRDGTSVEVEVEVEVGGCCGASFSVYIYYILKIWHEDYLTRKVLKKFKDSKLRTTRGCQKSEY